MKTREKKPETYWKRSDKTFCILLMTFLLWKSFTDLALPKDNTYFL